MADAAYRTWRPFPTFPHGRRLDGCIAGRIEGEGNLLVPSLRVDEEHGAYVVRASIPGVERSELTVSFQQGVLRIAGERRRATSSRTSDVQHASSYLSRFTREIRLEREVDVLEAEAHFDHGELTVRLPLLSPQARPRESDPTRVVIH